MLLVANMMTDVLYKNGHLGVETFVSRVHADEFRQEPFDNVMLFERLKDIISRRRDLAAGGRVEHLFFDG